MRTANASSCAKDRLRVAINTQHGSYVTRVFSETLNIGGEFDPGSGSTLAACLMHASRTGWRFGPVTWRTGAEHVGKLPRGGG